MNRRRVLAGFVGVIGLAMRPPSARVLLCAAPTGKAATLALQTLTRAVAASLSAYSWRLESRPQEMATLSVRDSNDQDEGAL